MPDTRTPGFEGDSESRIEHATSIGVVMSGADPADVIDDWGEYEGDYTPEQLQAADGVGNHEIYFDSCNSADNEIIIL